MAVEPLESSVGHVRVAEQSHVSAEDLGALYRVTAVPLHGPAEAQPDDTRAQLLAGLVGSHLSGERMVAGWVRTGPLRQVSVVVGNDALVAGTGEKAGEFRLVYPPGTEARLLHDDELVSLLGPMRSWVRCAGVFDPVGVEPSPETSESPWGSLEKCFAHLSHMALAWLVVADPVPSQDVVAHMEHLAFELPERRNKAASSEAHRIVLEREEAWYRELERVEPTGLWNVTVLAGGESASDASRGAALLCNTVEIKELPYRLRPSGPSGSLTSVLADREVDGRRGRSPFNAGCELLAAIARPPTREVPGVRLVRPPPFDVTSESAGPIRLGDVLDAARRRCGRLTVSESTLNRHTFVCGATGSGKSQTVRTLLEGLARARIPWLVIEPAKAEYASGMAGRLADHGPVTVIRPGDPSLIPGSLNPLEPEPGFPLQSHADMVRALFLAAFDAHEPFPQVLSYALSRCYERCGWDLALGTPMSSWQGEVPPRYPSLGDLRTAAVEVVEEIGYGREVTDNVRGFVDVRIRSLRQGSPGRFFENGHPLDVGKLLSQNVVFEMENVSNDQDKAFLMGTVLIRVFEHLRERNAREVDSPRRVLEHVTVIEEAHRLLRNVESGGPAAQAIELFANLLAEIRAYHEGIVVAEQIPSKVITDLIKNTALKIVHRLPAEDDRLAVGATMNMGPEQSEYVVTLPPGRAATFSDGMDRPLLGSIAYGEDRERGTADLVPPTSSRRSEACGACCRERACTMTEMRLAEEYTETEPALRFWVELLFVAHILGETEGLTPTERWLKGVRKLKPRRRECAVAHLVHQGVVSRYQHLRLYYRPEALGEHIRQLIEHTVESQSGPLVCAGGETQWTAGTRRWVDVRLALKAKDGGDRSKPHPRTADWARRGLVVHGATWEEQLVSAASDPASRFPRQRELEWGRLDRPAFRTAAAQLAGTTDPERSVPFALQRVGLTLPDFFEQRLIATTT